MVIEGSTLYPSLYHLNCVQDPDIVVAEGGSTPYPSELCSVGSGS